MRCLCVYARAETYRGRKPRSIPAIFRVGISRIWLPAISPTIPEVSAWGRCSHGRLSRPKPLHVTKWAGSKCRKGKYGAQSQGWKCRKTGVCLKGCLHRYDRNVLSHTHVGLSVSVPAVIGPIPWGHSGPLCHALSLSLSSLSSRTSMCRWRAATIPVATPGEWACGARSGEWAQHFSNASCCCKRCSALY